MMLGKLNIELADSIRPELWARVEQLLAERAARKPAERQDCAEGCPLARGPGEQPMTYVIAEPCIGVKDRSCVDVCPVDCIYGATTSYIEPDECIDCGACVPECPVTAIFTEEEVRQLEVVHREEP
jgi:NAD-dependent dihydropyrimidine dehydrogenase PreA subunit